MPGSTKCCESIRKRMLAKTSEYVQDTEEDIETKAPRQTSRTSKARSRTAKVIRSKPKAKEPTPQIDDDQVSDDDDSPEPVVCQTRYDGFLETLLVLVCLGHIYVCPYTKVEESFNMQAMHDIIHHRTNLSAYDHLTYPGVVPRTFLGPLFISILSAPFLFFPMLMSFDKFYGQLGVRAMLGFMICMTLICYKNRLKRIYGAPTANWFLLICMSQFHLMFYSSRSLPNVFALGLFIVATKFYLARNFTNMMPFICLCAVAFRSETAIILAPMILFAVFNHGYSFTKALSIGICCTVLAISGTFILDSLFWERFLWPEAEVFYFNTVQNGSEEYGVFPFHWYFTSVLPRALLTSLLLVPYGYIVESRVRSTVNLSIFFIMAMSLLPHKELRFIIYIFPIFNTAAAITCNKLFVRPTVSLVRHMASIGGLLSLIPVITLALNAVFTCAFLAASAGNYPGGIAMASIHELDVKKAETRVHIGNLAAQTGATRFTEIRNSWTYDKTENLPVGCAELRKFDYIISDYLGDSKKHALYDSTHRHMMTVDGFERYDFNKPGFTKVPRISIYIRRMYED